MNKKQVTLTLRRTKWSVNGDIEPKNDTLTEFCIVVDNEGAGAL